MSTALPSIVREQNETAKMKCTFTGKDADSSKHVIPLWLRTRFNLSEQNLVIPNGAILKYKHHRVPADTEPNNRFGVIENHISRGASIRPKPICGR